MKTKKQLKLFTLSIFVLFIVNISYSQLSVNNAITPLQMVVNNLVGTGVTVSNVTYNGDSTARGSFNGTSSNIGFASGVILATGKIGDAIGPNTSADTTFDFGTQSTDPDLSAIATDLLFDAAILEFDFVPHADTLKFKYVFASKEYPEYVCSTFNDVFGFFITGPNPAGGNYNAQNIAIIPGSTLPVAINTVNPGVTGTFGTPGGCQSLAYSNSYIDNTNGTTVSYDGFTVPLTAIAAVNCGQSYHIKIAIADVGDGAYDSGVFLQQGSFSSLGVTIVPQFSYGGISDSILYEGCGEACIHFIRTSHLAFTDTVHITIGGTATNSVDYNTGIVGDSLPSVIIFQPGQDTITYCINSVADGIVEGPESITLAIAPTGHCVQATVPVTLYINEFSPLMLTTSNDTTFCNQGGTYTMDALITGGVGPYVYSWSSGLPPQTSQTVTVNTTTSYTVSVSDACMGTPDPTPAQSHVITLTVATFAPLTVNAGDDRIVCPGDIVNLTALVTGGGSHYNYLWSVLSGTDSLSSYNTANTSYIATTPGSFQITVKDVCNNTQTDQVSVDVELSCTLNIPNIITPSNSSSGGINETFYVENLDKFPTPSLVIYNRWGNKIYESSNYKNDFGGTKYSDGTYYYVLTVNASGKILPNLKNNNSDIKTSETDEQKTFAGFFQITH